jgi:hypothetical protein
MENEKYKLRDQIIQLRKQLAELENQRIQGDFTSHPDIWNVFMAYSTNLEKAEQAVTNQNNKILDEIKQLRNNIKKTLSEFNHWCLQIRNTEKLFLVNILRPGFVLKQAIRQRQFLEKEYARMLSGIERYQYVSPDVLNEDIRQVINHGKTAFEADDESLKDELIAERNNQRIPDNYDLEEMEEEFNKDRLIRDFKRTVLPGIHPDTSDTPEEIFRTVFEVFERKDYLLMEAYIVEYGEEAAIEPDQDVLETQDKLQVQASLYHRLFERLKRRLVFLKKELTPQELDDPEKIERNLQEQKQEIQMRIRSETEKIFAIIEKIEGLKQYYFDHQPGSQNDG